MRRTLTYALVCSLLAACAHKTVLRPKAEASADADGAPTSCGVHKESKVALHEFSESLARAEAWWPSIYCDLEAEDNERARQKLETVLKLYAGRGGQAEAVAVFLMAEVQYRLGDNEKFAAYLHDAKGRAHLLPLFMREIELPLRIAQLSLRQNSLTDYEALSKEVSQRLSQLRRSQAIPRLELSRVLYQLGYFHWPQQESLTGFERHIQLWAWSQKFLIQVIEEGEPLLVAKATSLIVDNYRGILGNIAAWSRELASDQQARAVRQQEDQWEMVYQALHTMEQLKVLPLEPGADGDWVLKHLGEMVAIERELRTIYEQTPLEAGLTPASQGRQRPLRTLNPNPVFEDPNL